MNVTVESVKTSVGEGGGVRAVGYGGGCVGAVGISNDIVLLVIIVREIDQEVIDGEMVLCVKEFMSFFFHEVKRFVFAGGVVTVNSRRSSFRERERREERAG